MNRLPKTRAEAKLAGNARYFTGIPCIRGHLDLRKTHTGFCVRCAKDKKKKYRKERREEFNERNKASRIRNHAAFLERERKMREKSADRLKEAARKYRSTHSDAHAARAARRRAEQMLRTPAWSNQKKIKEMYSIARKLSAETGELYEVDHVIPLRGEIVSGLHVESNLQILTRHKNRSKCNRFEAIAA